MNSRALSFETFAITRMGYAAVTAVSNAKELLDIISEHQVTRTQTATAEMGV